MGSKPNCLPVQTGQTGDHIRAARGGTALEGVGHSMPGTICPTLCFGEDSRCNASATTGRTPENMIIRVHIQDRLFENRIRYVFRFIEEHVTAASKVKFVFDGEAADQKLNYGTTPGDGLFIPAQGLIFNEALPDPACLTANKYLYRNMTLYSVSDRMAPVQKFFAEGRLFAFDLIETIFYHISRYEEYLLPEEMGHSWALADPAKRFLPRLGLLKIPVVDHLIFAFLHAIGAQPERGVTRFRLTHDIDIPYKLPNLFKVMKSAGRELLIERRGLKAVTGLLGTYRQMRRGLAKDPYDTFDWLFRSESLDKSAYFMAGGITAQDNYYRIEDAAHLIRMAKDRGYAIGLHPSYEAYRDGRLFEREKARLERVAGQPVKRSRQHYLRFQFPVTPQIIEAQGIKEDSSLGYRDRIGFRCGTGFGYRLYDFDREGAFDFVEVPLILMDISLVREAGRDKEAMREVLFDFLDRNRYLTQVTVLFHNSIFDMEYQTGDELRALYFELVKRMGEGNDESRKR